MLYLCLCVCLFCVGDRECGLPLCVLWTFAFLNSTCDYSSQAYQPNTQQRMLCQWFPLTAKCLQAGPRGQQCFQAMRWPAGFGPGQQWWREVFYCAVSLYVWPLPEYKSLGWALKGPARASLPHTALQAILTQVSTHRRRHTGQSIHHGTVGHPHIQSQGPLPAHRSQLKLHRPGERPKQHPNEPPT